MIAFLNQFDTMNRTDPSSNDRLKEANDRSSAMDANASLLLLSSSSPLKMMTGNSSKNDEEVMKRKDRDTKENLSSPTKNIMTITEDDNETDHGLDHHQNHFEGDPLSLSSSSTSLFRSVSRRVTNESTNASDPSSHVILLQQLQARQMRRRQQQLMRNQRGVILDRSYEPNAHDVIVNLRTSDRPNTSFDEKLSSMRPLFVIMIRRGRSDLQHTFLLDVIESIERDGGRFIRWDGATWIHVSTTVAVMYTLHRLKQGMKQEQQVTAHEETEEKRTNDDVFSDFGSHLLGEEDLHEIDSDFMSKCSDDILSDDEVDEEEEDQGIDS